jgi:hypothetical protein
LPCLRFLFLGGSRLDPSDLRGARLPSVEVVEVTFLSDAVVGALRLGVAESAQLVDLANTPLATLAIALSHCGVGLRSAVQARSENGRSPANTHSF